MIVFFSLTDNTKLVASALKEMLNQPLFRLEAEKDSRWIVLFFKCIIKSSVKLKALPDLTGCDTFTLCSPVWAGGFTPMVTYFLKNADLKGKTVNVVLTCGSSTDQHKFEANAQKRLTELGHTPGTIHALTINREQKPTLEAVKASLADFVSKKGE